MVHPYLSTTPLENRNSVLREYIQASGCLPDPWEFHPSVVLTELRTEVSLSCDASSPPVAVRLYRKSRSII